jgi:hypothetical protein
LAREFGDVVALPQSTAGLTFWRVRYRVSATDNTHRRVRQETYRRPCDPHRLSRHSGVREQRLPAPARTSHDREAVAALEPQITTSRLTIRSGIVGQP